MKALINILLLSVFLTMSCSNKEPNIVINKDFVNEEWSRFEYLTGEILINEESANFDIIMEVKVTDSYPNVYVSHQDDSSLLFNMTIKYPNGSSSRSMNYKYTLKDNEGNWKADKIDGCYTFLLPIISEMTFGEKGIYTFKIENKYPKDPLSGIKSMTIKCINSNK